jgi:hypothetical protein
VIYLPIETKLTMNLNAQYAEVAKLKGDHHLLHPVKRPPSPQHERSYEYLPLASIKS